MRRAAPANARWTISFADLCLLLLGFFVIVQAQRGEGSAAAAGLRAAFGGSAPTASGSLAAADLFEPGEAVFRPRVANRLRLIGAEAGTRRVIVESSGADAGARRFDAWELAAARTAAVARAVASGGVDPARIDLVMAPSGTPGIQRIMVRTR